MFCVSWRSQASGRMRVGSSFHCSVAPKCCMACLGWGLSKGALLGQHTGSSESKGRFLPCFLEGWNPRSKNAVKMETLLCVSWGSSVRCCACLRLQKITLLSHFACYKANCFENQYKILWHFFWTGSNLGLSSTLIITFAWISLADFIRSMDSVLFSI